MMKTTGNLAGTLLAGWVIKRLGFNRSYYLASLCLIFIPSVDKKLLSCPAKPRQA
ncbi:hypothetical protein [Klebsiella quasipneumoniae]|uniref:hypothetical protein n=1 Tax=Klebsiella quasipneumoniae TaxID=1463165 RepID=UPI00220FE78D|nr:hypothetical protein [Klebsiella quasipneumoniae]BDO03776.1 hypothetical protein KAM622c_33630 [Klebsiella quasipneumoniae subsp. quasipneumoniae]